MPLTAGCGVDKNGEIDFKEFASMMAVNLKAMKSNIADASLFGNDDVGKVWHDTPNPPPTVLL